MKKLALFTLMILLTFSWAGAQEEEEIQTLFGGIDSHGGYGAFSLGYTNIDDRDALLMGFRGAWVVNHSLGIGIGGTAFMNEYQFDPLLSEDVNLQGGYGGLLIEPILGGQETFHFSFPVIIGAGGIVHANDYTHERYYDDYINDSDAFFVLEPGAELEVNLLKFFRVSVGAFYRYTSNIDLYDTDSDVLHGFSYKLTFKFGKF